MEKIIEQNDKPRAEIVVDVEILEVDRSRTKNYGINLSEYALGLHLLARGRAEAARRRRQWPRNDACRHHDHRRWTSTAAAV